MVFNESFFFLFDFFTQKMDKLIIEKYMLLNVLCSVESLALVN